LNTYKYAAPFSLTASNKSLNNIRQIMPSWEPAALQLTGEALIDCGMIYNTMIQRSNKSLIVVDHSKFDKVFPSNYASWQAIDRIITDSPPADHIFNTLVDISVCE
jgi:hypothetical protein